MDKLNTGQHISHRFDEELEDVRQRVMEMAGLVEEQLAKGIRALTESDDTLAEEVMRSDYKINALEVSIDEQCMLILARRQPAASDLRLVMAVIKTITDLERIGDEAERIGFMAADLNSFHFKSGVLSEISHMGELVRTQLHTALDSFARHDVEMAVTVAEGDVAVDKKYESITRQLMTYMAEDPRSIPVTLNILWAIRSLERIGDRARNISEYVVYLVKGKDVRHTSLEHVLEQAK